tara:strand:+ start:202 stop:720 length:519 start_codon:yes stop_codon:yes gene_type:complete
MRNTSWNRVQPGQIVNFLYQGKKDKRAFRRFVIILDPKHRVNTKDGMKIFVSGLQLKKFGEDYIPKQSITLAMRLLGGLASIKDKAGNRVGTQVNIQGVTSETQDPSRSDIKGVLNRLRRLIKREDILKTFDYVQCRRRRVYLETEYDRIPTTLIKELNTQIENGTEVIVED